MPDVRGGKRRREARSVCNSQILYLSFAMLRIFVLTRSGRGGQVFPEHRCSIIARSVCVSPQTSPAMVWSLAGAVRPCAWIYREPFQVGLFEGFSAAALRTWTQHTFRSTILTRRCNVTAVPSINNCPCSDIVVPRTVVSRVACRVRTFSFFLVLVPHFADLQALRSQRARKAASKKKREKKKEHGQESHWCLGFGMGGSCEYHRKDKEIFKAGVACCQHCRC